jgi:RNA polymerase sigma-70 factor, ECF subfamily
MEELEPLAARAVSGDEGALDELLVRIRPEVLRRCARFLPCREDAEEACQDTLMTVATKIGTLRDAERFGPWLGVVTSNCARQTYRSLKRRFAEQATERPPEVSDPRTTSVIAGSRIDLLDALEDLERAKPQLVPPFVLRDLGGLSYNEIASQLDTPLGTIKARIHEARNLLSGRLRVTH